jgi:hypothetical protein
MFLSILVVLSFHLGPGTYEIQKIGIRKADNPYHAVKVSFHSNDKRFKQDAHSYTKPTATSTEVGPGSYETQNYLIKKSFNVTVGAKPMKKKLVKKELRTEGLSSLQITGG